MDKIIQQAHDVEKFGRFLFVEIGSVRQGTSKWLIGKHDGVPHSGSYTQEEIKEIVAYAAERHITVVPEIEMPGHSKAALAAYPELSCLGGPIEVATRFGPTWDVFCPGKESVFTFLEHVLDEVMALFPPPFIHIGGDEVLKRRWKNLPTRGVAMYAEPGHYAERDKLIRAMFAHYHEKGASP